MKLLRFVQVACLVVTVTFSFSACGDDEPEPTGTVENGNGSNDGTGDDEGDDGGNGNVDQPSGEKDAMKAPSLADLGILFPVTSISNGGTTVHTFSYADGRMAAGTWYSATSFDVYSNPLKIVEENDYSDYGEFGRDTFYNIKTNAKGFITYADYKYEGERRNTDGTSTTWTDSGSCTVSYDNDGHIANITINLIGGDGVLGKYEYTYGWKDGNMISIDERTWMDKNGEEYTYSWHYTLGYGQAMVNPGIYLLGIAENDVLNDYWWYTGLLGEPTKNIPTGITGRLEFTETGGNTSSNEFHYDIEVTYNPNGSVASLTYSTNGHTSYDYIFGYE